MNVSRFLIPAAAVTLLVVGQATAQSLEEAERAEAAAAADSARAQAELSEADVARQLEEAERRMAEAARQIYQLSEQRLPQLRNVERRFEFLGDDRPRLGVNIGEGDTGPVEGVKVVAVTPGSAADEAGLRSGDIITSINDESLSAASANDANRRVLDFMAGVETGDVLQVEYLRDGKTGTVEVEPRPIEGRAWAFEAPAAPDIHVVPGAVDALRYSFAWPGNVWADMELVELSEGLGRYFGADKGVLVVSAPESDALQLEDGDVILSIDGREPSSVRHALRILGSYQAGEKLELAIMRDKRKRTLDIEIPDDRSSMRWETAPAPQPAAAPRPAAVPRPAPAPQTEKT